jgi:hypothetical protein
MRMSWIRLMAVLVLGTMGAPALAEPLREPSPAFRACYDEARLPWLVDLMAGTKDPGATVDYALRQIVGGGDLEQAPVRRHVEARRAGKHASAQAMAAAVFSACMTKARARDHRPDRLAPCFREQELLFDATNLRIYERRTLNETQAVLLERYGRDDAAGATVRRLVSDTYIILDPSGDVASFLQAQFELCMVAPAYAPPLR